jgi:hypothetical protein
MCPLPTWWKIARTDSRQRLPHCGQTETLSPSLPAFGLLTQPPAYLPSSLLSPSRISSSYHIIKRSPRQPHRKEAFHLHQVRLLSSTTAMFKPPLQTARRSVRQPVMSSITRRYFRSSAATDRTTCDNQAVNEFQAAQGTTTAGRIVNKLSMRLANDRATTRTEQLIWLAKYALESSTAQKTSTIPEATPDYPRGQESPSTVQEQPESHEAKATSATSESTGRQS